MVGIDPGLSGCISVISEHGLYLCHAEMDTTADFGHKISALSACDMLGKISERESTVKWMKARHMIVAVERAWARDSQSCTATFSQGMTYGTALELAHLIRKARESMGLTTRIELVAPITWTKFFFKGPATKADHIKMANLKFQCNLKKSQDGLADSLLIAEYARMKFLHAK